jgi:hypothetical protein
VSRAFDALGGTQRWDSDFNRVTRCNLSKFFKKIANSHHKHRICFRKRITGFDDGTDCLLTF